MTIAKQFRKWLHSYFLPCTRSSSYLDQSGHSILNCSLNSTNPSSSPTKNYSFRSDNDNQHHNNTFSSHDDSTKPDDVNETLDILTSKGHRFVGNRQKLRWFIEETFKDFENVLTINRGTLALETLTALAEDSRVLSEILTILVNTVGYNNPFYKYTHIGPYLITLFLQATPLQNHNTIWTILMNNFESSFYEQIHHSEDLTLIKHRNICVVFSFFAEKLFSFKIDRKDETNSILTRIVHFLINILQFSLCEVGPMIRKVYALICLEKLSLNFENRKIIIKLLKENNIFEILEEYEKDYVQNNYGSNVYEFYKKLERKDRRKRLISTQLGFCSQWLLDNYLVLSGRRFGFETIDISEIRATINVNDKSENMKLSANGFMLRCDHSTFEWARATTAVTTGQYYYEIFLYTNGLMQLGWSTDETHFIEARTGEELGVGDDQQSVGFDGGRMLIWFNAQDLTIHNKKRNWRAGDVVGFFADKDLGKLIFYLNGEKIYSVDSSITGNEFFMKPLFPTVSLTSFQQCYVNLGQFPFLYPPKRPFKSFYDRPDVDAGCNLPIIPMHIRAKRDSKSLCLSSLSSWSPTKVKVCSICDTHSVDVRCDNCSQKTCSDCVIKWTTMQKRVPGTDYPKCPFCVQKISTSSLK